MTKVGVIGCGYWGKNLVRNFHSIGALGSVCDRDRDVAGKSAATYNVPLVSLDEMLNSDVDGVVIAAPAFQHAELVKSALLKGKHVFVEKPLALSLEDGRELCALAQEKNLILMVGHLLQYHPAFVALKKLIDDGVVGNVKYIYSNRLNLGKFRKEENILWSFAPHDISMILSIVGANQQSVYATGMCHISEGVHDVTTTHIKFVNGVDAHIFVSWLHPYKEQKLVVVGDAGMVVFDDGLDWSKKLQIYPHKVTWCDGYPQPDKADPVGVALEEAEPLKLECQHFIDCIESGGIPRTDGLEGLRVLSVLHAAQQSLKSGIAIPIGSNFAGTRVHSESV